MMRYTAIHNNMRTKVTILLVFGLTFALITGCGGGGGTAEFYGGSTGGISLSWQAPSTNEDGTPLTDLGGYRLYYGTASGDYTSFINVGNYTTCSLGDLSADKVYYFAVKAYDTWGNESDFSNEVSSLISNI